MAAPVISKRHRGNRLGERRGKGDAASSRDASEEDNDNDVSDVGSLASAHASTAASTTSTAASSPRMAMPGSAHLAPVVGTTGATAIPPATKRALQRGRVEELGGEGSQSEGLDSPTYDGDVESSSTIGGTPHHAGHHHQVHHARRPSSPTPGASAGAAISPQTSQRLPTPKASKANLVEDVAAGYDYRRPTDVVVQKSVSLAEPTKSQTMPLSTRPSATDLEQGPPKMTQRPIELTEENIKAFVERAIHGQGAEDGVDRWWKTNPPPEGKVVRVYADGVYDLFHFGHGLQLRQAKLSFPKVQLLVGVVSDDLCASHKSAPSMTHAERCEAVRQCRWVDEVIPDAPWVVDQDFMDKHNIDYIAHDELVYPSKTHEDVYGFAKSQGRFVPTRRTPAISTSDLLERIVRGYRVGFFDSKLEKNGHPELLAADVDWDSSASMERRERRMKKGKEGLKPPKA